uniref:Uncharacterized protein n=1 Tax=Myoviridae sp. ctMYT7 TaxID=2825087 RepID=A0A8S5Q2B4_9CAUD|nr:MAG TPA: hypothetical protein [Myoviridae sp. ctMYT7]
MTRNIPSHSFIFRTLQMIQEAFPILYLLACS